MAIDAVIKHKSLLKISIRTLLCVKAFGPKFEGTDNEVATFKGSGYQGTFL